MKGVFKVLQTILDSYHAQVWFQLDEIVAADLLQVVFEQMMNLPLAIELLPFEVVAKLVVPNDVVVYRGVDVKA